MSCLDVSMLLYLRLFVSLGSRLPHSKASNNASLSNRRRKFTLHRMFQQEHGMRATIELRAIADIAFGSTPENLMSALQKRRFCLVANSLLDGAVSVGRG